MRQRVYDVLASRPGAREGRLWPEGSIRAAFEAVVEAARLDAPFRFHDCRHHFASWFLMRGGSRPALQKILGHASLAMTMRYAHLSPEHLRGEMAKTDLAEPNAGTRVGQRGQDAPEVIESTDERRGSSVAEQLIRNQ